MTTLSIADRDRLPKWDSHKLVWAAQIRSIDYAGRRCGPRNTVVVNVETSPYTGLILDVGYEVFQRARPDLAKEPAHLVVYEDGYTSWCPSHKFLRDHSLREPEQASDAAPHTMQGLVGTVTHHTLREFAPNSPCRQPPAVASTHEKPEDYPGGVAGTPYARTQITERQPVIGDIVQVWNQQREYIMPLIVVEVVKSPARGWVVSGRTVERVGQPHGEWLSNISQEDYRGLGGSRWRWPQ